MDRSMNNPADIPKFNNDLATGNQNVDTSSSSSSLPQSAVFNPAMVMMLQQQQQQEQFHADNFSAPQDATSGTFAPSGEQSTSGTFAPSGEQSIDATDVSSMLFSLANDMNNGMPSSYNHHQDHQQVQQQQVNQLPPTAIVQAFQDHQLHHHQNGMNPSMNTIVSSSINNDRTGNGMSMSSNQNTTTAGNFVETNPQQQQMPMPMPMQSMASIMPANPPAIAQQLLVQLQQQGPNAFPSIALLTNSLGNAIINNPAATQQQHPAAQPSSSSAAAAVAVASALTNGVAPRPKKVGRRGDPRMHEAVRYRLTHPKCTLLDALLHGGFSFPPLHLVNISDRFVRDSNGVTLSQRKNQLMRRLRVIEKGEESNDGDKKKKKKKTSSKKTTKKDDDDSSKSGDDGSTCIGTKSKGSGNDDASNDGDCGANFVTDGPPVLSSSMALPSQQVQVHAMPDSTAVMVPSLPNSSSEGQGLGSEMELQIRNQLLINQLKMVRLQQQIQEMAQAQVQNQQQEEEEQQQMNANDTLMSLQTGTCTSAPTEEGAADERNAKSA